MTSDDEELLRAFAGGQDVSPGKQASGMAMHPREVATLSGMARQQMRHNEALVGSVVKGFGGITDRQARLIDQLSDRVVSLTEKLDKQADAALDVARAGRRRGRRPGCSCDASDVDGGRMSRRDLVPPEQKSRARARADLDRARARHDETILAAHRAAARVRALEADLVVARRALDVAEEDRFQALDAFSKALCAAEGTNQANQDDVICAQCGQTARRDAASWDVSGWFCAPCRAAAGGGA